MVTFYSSPHQELLELSYNTTLLSCAHQKDLKEIDMQSIRSVVAMVLHQPFGEPRYFVVEKPGLDVGRQY